MKNEQKINHYAVWLCVILFQILSALWYSPALFANVWMGYLGKTMSDFNGESPTGLIYALLGAISFNYFLSWLFIQLGIKNGLKGGGIGLILALCCFTLQTFTHDGFSMRPIGLSFINSGSIILNFMISGCILGAWKKHSRPEAIEL
jgi:hypothetical protein